MRIFRARKSFGVNKSSRDVIWSWFEERGRGTHQERGPGPTHLSNESTVKAISIYYMQQKLYLHLVCFFFPAFLFIRSAVALIAPILPPISTMSWSVYATAEVFTEKGGIIEFVRLETVYRRLSARPPPKSKRSSVLSTIKREMKCLVQYLPCNGALVSHHVLNDQQLWIGSVLIEIHCQSDCRNQFNLRSRIQRPNWILLWFDGWHELSENNE